MCFRTSPSMPFLFPTGDVTGDMMGSGFHYSRVRGDFGDSRQDPMGRQAWCILFTEQLALQQSNKKYF